MTEQEMLERTKRFSLRVVKLVTVLSTNAMGRTIGNQLLRAGTSVGANYRAACRGRSKAEFIAKLGIVEEEADESTFWLEIVMESGLMTSKKVAALHQEANEITAIVAASRKTAKATS